MSFYSESAHYYKLNETSKNCLLQLQVLPSKSRNVCAEYAFETNLSSALLFIPPQTKFWGYIGIAVAVCLSVGPSVRLSVQSKHNLDNNFLTKGDIA